MCAPPVHLSRAVSVASSPFRVGPPVASLLPHLVLVLLRARMDFNASGERQRGLCSAPTDYVARGCLSLFVYKFVEETTIE